MEEKYEPQVIERQWQARWQAESLFRVTEDEPRAKYYLLEKAPYPSGNIHIGHVLSNTIGLIDELGISVFGTSAKWISAVEKAGVKPGDKVKMSVERVDGALTIVALQRVP